MLASATRLSMRAQVDSMKSMMVQRVSNADRARYALRASPDAYPRKERNIDNVYPEKELPEEIARVTFFAEATR
jgi:hypothetical protein